MIHCHVCHKIIWWKEGGYLWDILAIGHPVCKKCLPVANAWNKSASDFINLMYYMDAPYSCSDNLTADQLRDEIRKFTEAARERHRLVGKHVYAVE